MRLSHSETKNDAKCVSGWKYKVHFPTFSTMSFFRLKLYYPSISNMGKLVEVIGYLRFNQVDEP